MRAERPKIEEIYESVIEIIFRFFLQCISNAGRFGVSIITEMILVKSEPSENGVI